MSSRRLANRLDRAADLCGRSYVNLVRAIRGSRPVAAEHWRKISVVLNSIFRTQNSMHSKTWLIAPSSKIRSREVRQLLGEVNIGGWALDAATTDLLWSILGELRPTTLMEFGSGLSTIVLAGYCKRLGAAWRPMVWSIEQNAEVLEQTRRRLQVACLDSFVNLVHAPLSAECTYQIDTKLLARDLDGRRVDFLLIDGPSGKPGCRQTVLKQVARFCRPGAPWFLDDAFRDAEFDVLRTWMATPGIRVSGIYPVGKGFATGLVEAPW